MTNYVVRPEFEGKNIGVDGVVMVISKAMSQKDIKKLILHDELNQRFFYPVTVADEPKMPEPDKKS